MAGLRWCLKGGLCRAAGAGIGHPVTAWLQVVWEHRTSYICVNRAAFVWPQRFNHRFFFIFFLDRVMMHQVSQSWSSVQTYPSTAAGGSGSTCPSILVTSCRERLENCIGLHKRSPSSWLWNEEGAAGDFKRLLPSSLVQGTKTGRDVVFSQINQSEKAGRFCFCWAIVSTLRDAASGNRKYSLMIISCNSKVRTKINWYVSFAINEEVDKQVEWMKFFFHYSNALRRNVATPTLKANNKVRTLRLEMLSVLSAWPTRRPSHINVLLLHFAAPAHKSPEGLDHPSFWKEPLVGVPGSCTPSTASHHSHIYGPADHSCDRQQERAQTEGQCSKLGLLTNCIFMGPLFPEMSKQSFSFRP